MEIEWQSGNHWITVSEENTEKYIERAAKFNEITTKEIIEQLKTGKSMNYDQGWDDKIREATLAKERVKTVEKKMAENARCRPERDETDYLGTHDTDWYEDY